MRRSVSRGEGGKETNLVAELRAKAQRSQIEKQAKQKSQLASAIGKLARLEDRMANMGQQLEDAQDLLLKSKLSRSYDS